MAEHKALIDEAKRVTSFQCDGRQHCSQMTSRSEAEFFIRNCPNTKMDGDGDGIPCENDSRF
ncbi:MULTISPECIES: excalibur calcium-binding domain-containing protein [Marinobacter]|nr:MULTISPECIES: excalibur calcium-binding domain-containing protein [Marinobacter]